MPRLRGSLPSACGPLLLVCGVAAAYADGPPRLDLHGDPLPQAAVVRLGSMRWCGGPVHVLAVAPDGKTIASGHPDGAISLWDAASGRELRRWAGHAARTTALVFADKGRALASGGQDGMVALWDVATGKQLHRAEGYAVVTDLVVTPDGKRLVIAAGGEGRLWELATKKELDRLPNVVSLCFALSPDGRLVASGGTGRVITLWDMRSGKELHHFDLGNGRLTRAAFTRDGRTLVSWDSEGCLCRWDVAGGKRLAVKDSPADWNETVFAIAPGAALAASGNRDGKILLVEPGTGREVRRLDAHAGPVGALAFTADGRTLVSGGRDDCMIAVWDVATGKDVSRTFGHRGPVTGLAYEAGGRRLLTAGHDATVRLWDVATGREVRRWDLPAPVVALAQSPTGPVWAALTAERGGVHFGGLEDGKAPRYLRGPEAALSALAFSPDGKRLAVAGKKLHLWQVGEDGASRELSTAGLEGSATSVAFSADGKALVGNLGVQVWDRQLAQQGLRRSNYKLQGFSLWELSTREDFLLSRDGGDTVLRVGFTRDGRGMLTANADRTVRLWEVATRGERMHLEDPAGVTCVAPGPDGKAFASADEKGTVRLWSAVTRKELARFQGHRGRAALLAFSPDGSRLASASADGTVLIWEVPSPGERARLEQAPAGDWPEKACMWDALDGDDAAWAYAVMCALYQRPQEAPALLEKRLRLVVAVAPGEIERLIRELGDRRFRVREKAEAELERLYEQVLPALRKALAASPDLESQRRLTRLVGRIQGWLRGRELPLWAMRSVEVLEHLGTPESRRLLDALAKGAPAAALTREAQASLRRLTAR